MAATGVIWEVPPSLLAKNTADYAKRLYGAVVTLAEFFANKMEAYAKQHAPWTDRTGHARQSLVGRSLPTAAAVAIVLASLAEYGIWLEIAHGGVWGIILPTIQAHLGEIQAALHRLVS
jgi:hypothetical protein